MPAKILKQEIVKLKIKWKRRIFLSNNSIVSFEMDKKNNWWQSGASKDELWITAPIVEQLWNEFVSK
ncbi:MAG: hypothetical protein HY738_21680 [Bacteroidia bacterium]|nr:hypothetical protein [Bacteroidia bacterium]